MFRAPTLIAKIATFLVAAYMLLVPTAAASPSPTPPPTPPAPPTKAELQVEAVAVAQEHGFSTIETHEFLGTIGYETGGTWDCSIQSQAYNAKDGGRELSFGLAMIHLPDHKDVSEAQAKDCNFALHWMADQWDKGLQAQWTEWRIHYAK